MEKPTAIIEVRDRQDEVLFRLHVLDTNKLKTSKTVNGNSGQKGGQPDSHNSEALMTQAQKRYLFRIAADQGYAADEAHEHLKHLFQVGNLKDVTKFEASQMIERLLAETQGGA